MCIFEPQIHLTCGHRVMKVRETCSMEAIRGICPAQAIADYIGEDSFYKRVDLCIYCERNTKGLPEPIEELLLEHVIETKDLKHLGTTTLVKASTQPNWSTVMNPIGFEWIGKVCEVNNHGIIRKSNKFQAFGKTLPCGTMVNSRLAGRMDLIIHMTRQ